MSSPFFIFNPHLLIHNIEQNPKISVVFKLKPVFLSKLSRIYFQSDSKCTDFVFREKRAVFGTKLANFALRRDLICELSDADI